MGKNVTDLDKHGQDAGATKGMWLVEAGVVPGQADAHFTRRWEYTSRDYEADLRTPPDQPTKLDLLIQEVLEYQGALTNPRYFNWVNCQFIWL